MFRCLGILILGCWDIRIFWILGYLDIWILGYLTFSDPRRWLNSNLAGGAGLLESFRPGATG